MGLLDLMNFIGTKTSSASSSSGSAAKPTQASVSPTSYMAGWSEGSKSVWDMAAPNRSAFGDSEIWNRIGGLVLLGWGATSITVFVAIMAWKMRWTGYTSIGFKRTVNTVKLVKWVWDGYIQNIFEHYAKAKKGELAGIQLTRTVDDVFDFVQNLLATPEIIQMVTRG